MKSIRENRRAMTKLLRESNRMKEVLSANKQEVPFFVEGLVDGNDFKTRISREQFENACKPLLSRVLEPIETVLKTTNKTIADLDGIELLGGGVRIPKI